MEQDQREVKRAKNTVYRYLTIRPRSRKEVESRLDDRGFTPAVSQTVIDHLMQLGYINDAQFARDWAASRVRTRGFGRRRITQELRTKGIDAEIIRETVAELFKATSEAEVAKKVAAKKLRTMSRLDAAVRRRRLAGFLERKGFSVETIRALLRTLL